MLREQREGEIREKGFDLPCSPSPSTMHCAIDFNEEINF
jgi:hypothetical protein